jgi:hypothetical protein
VQKSKPSSLAWILGVVALFAAVAIIVGMSIMGKGHGEQGSLVGAALIAAGVVGLLLACLAVPIHAMIERTHETHARHLQDIASTLTDRLQQISVMLGTMSEQQMLSDTAKSVAFRDKDRDAIRRAIREEIARQDWEAATVLADEIERQFGYKHEAERFREEIQRTRNDTVKRQIGEQTIQLEKYVTAESWGLAIQEAQRVMALFPNEPTVQNLPQEIETRRQEHKRRLLESWNDAVSRHDVDGSIEILKRLDLYLTPAEGETMQETARGVFKEKLNILRMQFSLAVQDHKWSEAVRLGESIVGEFPNSRMAQEVAEKMDALRKRAVNPEMAKA